MPKILHSIAVQERAVGADAVEIWDLPVNPLSVLLIAIRPLNNTGTLTDFASYLRIVGALNRITIAHRGASVISMSGRDMAVLNYLRHGCVPREANPDDADNERRCVVLPVFLGRFAYDPVSCFPATKRGELTLELDIDIADTGYDGLRYSVESVELLGVNPREFERKTVIARTWPATGDNEIELPIGNQVRGLMLFGTTDFTGAAPAPSWGRVEVRMNNEEHSFAASDFEVAMMLNSLMGRQPPALDAHTHRVTTDGNAQTGLESTFPIEQGMDGWEDYAYLDFDPTRDDYYSIDTKGASSFQIRSDAESADAVRVIPIERMMVRN